MKESRNERLYPRWTNSRYYGLIALRKAIEYVIQKYIPVDDKKIAIDLGCGSMPYKPLFTQSLKQYLGADIALNKSANLLLNADTGVVDVESKYADYIISTQVLEHVVSPEKYLTEAHRICKDEGILFLSTHGFWLYHPDPTDYWRWTAAGLEKILKDNQWEPIEKIGLLGFAAAATALFQDAIVKKLPGFLQKPFWIVMQRMVAFFDSFYTPYSRQENAALYLVIARKVSGENSDN